MSIIPKKLAIFYDWPNIVNNSSGDIQLAVDTFKQYDLLVFGKEGLANPAHDIYNDTMSIINHVDMVDTQVFGYIDATTSLDEIQDKIDLWAKMGVYGIFMDRFGYDFNVAREKQRAIIWSIHHTSSVNTNNKLKVFVNSTNPDDVFSSDIDVIHNPTGKDTRLNSEDWYLAESFAVVNGNYDDADVDSNGTKDWQDKANKLINYRNTRGFNIAAIATSGDNPYDPNKAEYSYFASAINRFNAWGWGEFHFSAFDSFLPFRDRPDIIGTAFTGNLTSNNGVFQRQINVGVKIDTNNHTVGYLIDI